MAEAPVPNSEPAGAARRLGGALVLAGWGALVLVIGATLMAAHVISLPVPAAGDRRLRAAIAPGPALATQRWSVLHVLYESCGCSKRVLAHLLQRQARLELDETMLYVRDTDPTPAAQQDAATLPQTAEKARAAGFRFRALTPAALEQDYHLESAPLLVVAAPDGDVRYLGGYVRRAGSNDMRDLDIVDRVRRGARVDPLPVFGCAVSGRLQAAVDPLGIKYRRESL